MRTRGVGRSITLLSVIDILVVESPRRCRVPCEAGEVMPTGNGVGNLLRVSDVIPVLFLDRGSRGTAKMIRFRCPMLRKDFFVQVLGGFLSRAGEPY